MSRFKRVVTFISLGVAVSICIVLFFINGVYSNEKQIIFQEAQYPVFTIFSILTLYICIFLFCKIYQIKKMHIQLKESYERLEKSVGAIELLVVQNNQLLEIIQKDQTENFYELTNMLQNTRDLALRGIFKKDNTPDSNSEVCKDEE